MDNFSRMGLSAQTSIVNARRGDLHREAAEARLLRTTSIDEARPVVGRSLRRRVASFFERQARPVVGVRGTHIGR